MVSTPKSPDPQQTANAQAGMNRDTAITQQQLNMVDQSGPYGSLSYAQTGTNKFKDANGAWVETPKYTQTTTLSPQQQKILDQTQGANLNLGTIANERSRFLKGYLKKPFDVNSAARLDPRFAKQQDQIRTQLISSGIRPGSAAYTAAMNDFEQSRNDAYNELALNGRQQAFQEASYERNQPLNEIGALLSGSQVQAPQFASAPQASVGGVDYTGLVNNKYQADVQSSNAAMGGLFGLAAAPFSMFKFSDVRLKSDVKQVGALFNGLPIYAYTIGGTPEIGLLAHEVEQVRPEAVKTHESGFKMVDYGKAAV